METLSCIDAASHANRIAMLGMNLPWLAWTGKVAHCVGTLAVMASGGCSDPDVVTYPVRGIVRFTDGKLLREGTVEFETLRREKPITATGEIGPDGSFVLGTYESDDGAVVGKHRAVVIADYEIGTGYERPWLIPEAPLHPKYRDFRSSGLMFEVKPEDNDIIIEVEYAPAKE